VDQLLLCKFPLFFVTSGALFCLLESQWIWHHFITSSLHPQHELTCFGEISMQQAALAAKSKKSTKQNSREFSSTFPIH
jgi:hypothetical protein